MTVLGDVTGSDFAYWYPCYRSVVCLFVCLSVCLSDCHIRALGSNSRRCRHNFFCIRQPYVSLRSR